MGKIEHLMHGLIPICSVLIRIIVYIYITSDHMHALIEKCTLVSLLDFPSLPPPIPPPKIIVVKDLISLSATNFNRNGGFVLFYFGFFSPHVKMNAAGVSHVKSNQLFKSCRIQVHGKGSCSLPRTLIDWKRNFLYKCIVYIMHSEKYTYTLTITPTPSPL